MSFASLLLTFAFDNKSELLPYSTQVTVLLADCCFTFLLAPATLNQKVRTLPLASPIATNIESFEELFEMVLEFSPCFSTYRPELLLPFLYFHIQVQFCTTSSA